MTVSTNTNSQTITLDGVATSFAFTGFVGVSASNISATLRDLTGAIQSIGSFTITLNSPAAGQLWGIGGTIALSSAFTAGWTVTLVRTLDLTQTSVFNNQGNMLPALVERSFDRLTMTIQQVAAISNRSLRPPPGETFPDLPVAAQRASKYLAFDASGQPIVITGTSGVPSVAWTDITGRPSTFPPAAHTLDSHSNVNTAGLTTGQTLVWNGTAWVPGTSGGGGFRGNNGLVGTAASGDIFRQHAKTLTSNTTIAATENAVCAGPLTVNVGVTLTVAAGGRLVIT